MAGYAEDETMTSLVTWKAITASCRSEACIDLERVTR